MCFKPDGRSAYTDKMRLFAALYSRWVDLFIHMANAKLPGVHMCYVDLCYKLFLSE